MTSSNTSRNRGFQWLRAAGWMLAGLAVAMLARPARALDPDRTMSQYIHEKWGADRGFLGGSVYAISQSTDGYLWVGTERGLVRFDGANFALIQQPIADAQPIGPVRGLLSDVDGNLWVRPEGPHLLRYRDGVFEDVFSRFDLKEITFTTMALDDKGHLLLSGLGDRTFRYYQGKIEPLSVEEEEPGPVISLTETRDRQVWMGTRDEGLFRIVDAHVRAAAKELSSTRVNCLLPALDGGLWVGTDSGILFRDGSGFVPQDLPAALHRLPILALLQDRDGNIWVGSAHGLARITPNRAVAIDQLSDSPGKAVTAIYQDRDGDLWYGGPKGIERLRNGVFTTYSTADGLPSDSNGAVYVDSDGRTWFAPIAGGLYWLKEGRVGRVAVDGLADDVVYSISGGEGEVWIGRQRGGLTRLTPDGAGFAARTYTQKDGLVQNSIYSVHENRDGTVWAGSVSAGVSMLRDGAFTNYSTANRLSSNAVNSIVEGQDGTMWFATPGGLDSFAHGQWENYGVPEGLPSSNVSSIFEDSKRVLWIATANGLAFFSSGHMVAPANLPEALNEQIFGFAEDNKGYLWATTSDHVVQVDRDRLLTAPLRGFDLWAYGISDGLLGVEGVRRDRSVVADHLGRIWMSLNHGLSMFDPRPYDDGPTPYTVRIDSVSTDKGPFSLSAPPKMPAGTERVTFDYAGASLSTPGRVRFRYKLDGFDPDWSDSVALRQVTYTNLGPGPYRFRVIVSSREGLWNGPETSVAFSIERAFWQTWWFRLSCAAAGLLLVFALYRLRMYQLTRQLNMRFQERLSERTRIAQELHDTLLQGFLSASMQLDVADDQLAADSPAKPRVKRVLQLMGQVIEEGRNALRGLRGAETDNRNLELAFSRLRQELATDESIDFRVMADSVTRPVHPMIRDEVYRIGREALVNAFRHAHANTVEVEVEYARRHLRVLVRDDGCGIDPQVLSSGREGHWGLPGMRERSEGIGASLRLRSRVGAGTEVELTVPSAIAFEGAAPGSRSPWRAWYGRSKSEHKTNRERHRANK